MSNIYLFRGKAATGKTSITNLLSKKLGVPVIRKDDIYDEVLREGTNIKTGSAIAYNALAKVINTNTSLGCDVIVDVSLIHNAHFEEFLSKLDLENNQIHNFMCVCSDEKMWECRLAKRKENPSPNQNIFNIEDANEHYCNLQTELMDNEVVIDSVEDTEVMMDKVLRELNDK